MGLALRTPRLADSHEPNDWVAAALLQRPLRPGDGTAVVPVGTVHDWWNSGAGIARVRVEIEAAPGAPPGTADRFVAMMDEHNG